MPQRAIAELGAALSAFLAVASPIKRPARTEVPRVRTDHERPDEHGAGLIDLGDYLPRSSRKSCKLEGTSPWSAQRWRSSLAISSVTSRDQP
jgi:hypothetical protein